jgi:hypothetical protein
VEDKAIGVKTKSCFYIFGHQPSSILGSWNSGCEEKKQRWSDRSTVRSEWSISWEYPKIPTPGISACIMDKLGDRDPLCMHKSWEYPKIPIPGISACIMDKLGDRDTLCVALIN